MDSGGVRADGGGAEAAVEVGIGRDGSRVERRSRTRSKLANANSAYVTDLARSLHHCCRHSADISDTLQKSCRDSARRDTVRAVNSRLAPSGPS